MPILWLQKKGALEDNSFLNAYAMFIQSCTQSLKNLFRKQKHNCALICEGVSPFHCTTQGNHAFAKQQSPSYSSAFIDLVLLMFLFFSVGYLLLLMGLLDISFWFLHLSDCNLPSFERLLCHLSYFGSCFENAFFFNRRSKWLVSLDMKC